MSNVIVAPCIVCGDATPMACADCAIDSSGGFRPHICRKSECRLAHERAYHPDKIEAQFRAQVQEAKSRPIGITAFERDYIEGQLGADGTFNPRILPRRNQ